MTNSADPDQLASSEANWSGSTLFANVGHYNYISYEKILWIRTFLSICWYCQTNKYWWIYEIKDLSMLKLMKSKTH